MWRALYVLVVSALLQGCVHCVCDGRSRQLERQASDLEDKGALPCTIDGDPTTDCPGRDGSPPDARAPERWRLLIECTQSCDGDGEGCVTACVNKAKLLGEDNDRGGQPRTRRGS
jgi:hypothetical protein